MAKIEETPEQKAEEPLEEVLRRLREERERPPEQRAEERIEWARRKNAIVLDLMTLFLTTLPESLWQLTQLQELYLSDSELSHLPESLGQLTQLREFDLGGNQLNHLPESLGKLTQLRWLSVTVNRLKCLPESLGQLKQLEDLQLSRNQLSRLPESLGQLTRLRCLNLSDNQLSRLPESLLQLKNLKELYLHGNEALGIPLEVLGPTSKDAFRNKVLPAHPADILNYYFRNRREEWRTLREAKILVVGQGTVGKTCLIKRLLNQGYNPDQNKTEGIDITRWPLPAAQGGGELRVNVWDFGGQEVMHPTHKFFLTKRSLYLLVIDARKGEDESRLHYWLKIIESFGTDSPILVVINKMDAHHLELNEPRLQKDYPGIRGFFPVSCATGDGIAALQAAIIEHVNALPHVYDPVPNSFFLIKQELEAMAQARDYLDEHEYRSLCEKHGVDAADDQNLLLRFLHDLGNVLNYADPDSPHDVRDTNILNPEWVTRGVYKIINDVPLTRDGGILTRAHLHHILCEGYPGERPNFIVGMMQKFELCFSFGEGGGKSWLVPDLLSPKEIEFGWDNRDTLKFEYHYEVLPPGLISRFLVKSHLNLNLEKQSYWRSGAMLSIDGLHAIVRADSDKNKVFIAIDGPPPRRRHALAVIRERFREIHATIPGLKFEERIPLPDNPNVTVGYQHLLELEDKGREFVWPEGAKREYRVKELMKSIEDDGKFDVFLSHNSKNKPAVRELKKHLEARGLRVWLDEDELPPGRPWQEELENIIATTKSAAVLVGRQGLGPWEEPEMRACLSEFVKRKMPVIPVLLPGAPKKVELPMFLQAFTWVDLRGGFDEAGLDRLEFGITGRKPQR